MKSLVTAFFILPLISISAHAQAGQQSACRLTEAPTIRGVRLGMSTRELLALFPGSEDRMDIKERLKEADAPAGSQSARLIFEPASYSSRERFARIDTLSALVQKGRLTDYTVTYIGPNSNGPRWRSVDEWIAKLAEAFKLPESQGWATSSEESPNKVLKCGGFEIEASTAGGVGSVTVRSKPDLREEMQMMEVEQERKRREFKP